MFAGAIHVRHPKRAPIVNRVGRKKTETGATRRNSSVGSLRPTSAQASTSSTQSPVHNLQVPDDEPIDAVAAASGGGGGGLRRRAGSAPTIRLTLAVAWSLNAEHVRALKVTWARLCDVPRSNCRGIVHIVGRVIDKFDASDKRVRECFYQAAFVDSLTDCHYHHQHAAAATAAAGGGGGGRNGRRASSSSMTTLHDHILHFVSLLSQVIKSLDHAPTTILDHLDRIGAFHHYTLQRCGFHAQMWEKLGVCLVDALVVQETVRGFPAACKAWTILVAALIDRLRSARKSLVVTSLRNSTRRISSATALAAVAAATAVAQPAAAATVASPQPPPPSSSSSLLSSTSSILTSSEPSRPSSRSRFVKNAESKLGVFMSRRCTSPNVAVVVGSTINVDQPTFKITTELSPRL